MQPDQHEQRSPLGLGPLETAIMQVTWEADDWLMVRDIRDRMDCPAVAYTTVAKVTSILHEKGLLIRRLGDRTGKPGPSAWWYRAARSMNEHIGELIAPGYLVSATGECSHVLSAYLSGHGLMINGNALS